MRLSQKPFSLSNLFELAIKDEKQLRKIEKLINEGISTSQLCRAISVDPRITLSMLAKLDKSVSDYESKFNLSLNSLTQSNNH